MSTTQRRVSSCINRLSLKNNGQISFGNKYQTIASKKKTSLSAKNCWTSAIFITHIPGISFLSNCGKHPKYLFKDEFNQLRTSYTHQTGRKSRNLINSTNLSCFEDLRRQKSFLFFLLILFYQMNRLWKIVRIHIEKKKKKKSNYFKWTSWTLFSYYWLESQFCLVAIRDFL